MMDRRRLLQGTTVTAASSLAGCAGKLKERTDSVGGGSRTIGDAATYEGVKVTPDKYVLADSATRVYGNNRRTINAAEGATFILTHLKVSHEGDSAQEFPKSTMQDTIDLFYDSKRVSESMRDDATKAYIIDEKKLTTYDTARYNADAMGEVYPGTEIAGWLFHEVAANFDPSKLELRITWNQQMVSNEGETVQKWTYTEDAEVSIDGVDNDGDGKSISL